MNQDIVIERLLQIEESKEHFDLIFTGKNSKRVDGFYRPEERKIYIHNRNMKDENQLIYTAIHEYAHHLHVTSSMAPISNRCHTRDFWNVFHRLLKRAEELGFYKNPLDMDPDLKLLTDDIKENFLKQNGELMKEFGQKLVQAQNICRLRNINFSDYADRVLGLGRSFAKSIIKVSQANVDTSIGFENMRTVAAIPKAENRKAAVAAFREGKSPDQVKTSFSTDKKEATLSVEDRLKSEKNRIKRTIESLSKKLSYIEDKLANFESKTPEF